MDLRLAATVESGTLIPVLRVVRRFLASFRIHCHAPQLLCFVAECDAVQQCHAPQLLCFVAECDAVQQF